MQLNQLSKLIVHIVLARPYLVENCTLWGNEDIGYAYNAEAKFRNNILDNALPEGCEDLGGNIWSDPMFADADSGDYHLLSGSPCIDAGFDTLASYYSLFDYDYNFRIWDGTGNDTARIDIGVYEYGASYMGGIAGYVYKDAEEYEPLPYVLLKINNVNSKHEFSDSTGYYEFNILPGVYDIYASRVFYDDIVIEDVEVVAGEVSLVNFTMAGGPPSVIKKDNKKSISSNILMYNFPNPFNPTTTIAFTIPKNSQVYLGIYDISGKLIKTLIDAPIEAGYHTVVWDGTDDNGRSVSSGVYFYKLKSKGYEETKKMLLLK